MKPMLPTLTFDVPKGENWVYEVKYDGFRAILTWDNDITLISRNGKELLSLFPEIEQFLVENRSVFEPYLPFVLDGELVFLENRFKAGFDSIQVRGRMRSEQRIHQKAKASPCRLLIFDILQLKGKSLKEKKFIERKEILLNFFKTAGLPLEPDEKQHKLVQMIPAHKDFKKIWEKVILYDGEGIVAKQVNSHWTAGTRTREWIKNKNWKYVSCFISAYEKTNGYFYASVFKDGSPVPIGNFLFGLKPEEKNALFQIVKENKIEEDSEFIYVEPAICVELKYLEIYELQMREPHFERFRFDLMPEECTFEKFVQQQKNVPVDVEITHPDKPLWETPPIKKIDYIHYLREISPYFLPFLRDRLLTTIRYPHGIFGEAFFQKNRPDYTPEFIDTSESDGIYYIVCNDLKSLLWLGNQLAFEFHVPFQTIHSTGPSEIVFDLDPPSKDAFPLAIKAARLIKEVLDHLKLISFIKTSGNKGLQVYLPLPENRFSYEQTRMFTSFVADYLVSKDPDSFTVERMKKKRGKRLYVDYVQHAEGKTIIAPYSPRGNKNATISAPLFWEEVNEKLTIDTFQITTMLKRLKTQGCPFQTFFQTKEIQSFEPVLEFLTNGAK
ncbi:DNA ligase D [Bacillus sp. V33-4]|uniref:DNA ligase D n=1 Tax=Bacillus sp. V33-4 TaxID=2054169 RepID=UPI000C761750|nr:DNA ligase D [Bacillus sp. V33-4]PLR83419.1 DNA ligase D [Bacillus sp. V33-4]